MRDDEKIVKILDVIRDEILPLTECEVKRGNHVFGGAILRQDTLTSVMVGSNNRVDNPLFHGEMDALNRFFKLPVRPRPDELIFLATHEPCPMCAAAIAWAGFKEVWVLFGEREIAEDFGMPIDAEMYRDLFGSGGVRPENKFFRKYSIIEAIEELSAEDKVGEIMEDIKRRYAALAVSDFEYPGGIS
jgi:tRNA(Arg) A34 adenosine deaminase TadA